jgi:hypothetical protein
MEQDGVHRVLARSDRPGQIALASEARPLSSRRSSAAGPWPPTGRVSSAGGAPPRMRPGRPTGRQEAPGYDWVMIAADLFRPGQWTDFFLLVGTGAVTLTGLVFVAMSLNLKAIAIDATHRNRAINTLTGLALVFMRCALVLMGAQNHRSIGAELFVVSGISAAVFVKGYARAMRTSSGLRLSRVAGGSLIHLTEMIGAAVFFFGYLAGLYIAALAMVTNTCYMITAAWLLVIGAFDQETNPL